MEGKRNTGIPVPGDHIFVPRSFLYSHHGIFLSREEGVIHYQTPMESGHPDPSACRVVLTDLATFVGPDIEWYIYRYGVSTPETLSNKYPKGTYSTAPSDEPAVVMERAHRLLRDGFGHYNIVGNNCEDFAIFCKTGRRSTESALFSAALGSVAATRQAVALGYKSPLVYAGCAMGLFTAGQLKRSNQNAESTRVADLEDYKEDQIRMADLAALERYENELLSKIPENGDAIEPLVNGITCINGVSCVGGETSCSLCTKRRKVGTSETWDATNGGNLGSIRETDV